MCGWSHSAHCKVLNPVLASVFLIATLNVCFCLLPLIKHFPCVKQHTAKGRARSKAELPSLATMHVQNSTGGSDIRELAVLNPSWDGYSRVARPEKTGGENPQYIDLATIPN